ASVDCGVVLSFFFFQAEDGIRDFHVTGVQTCALPILVHAIQQLHDGVIGKPFYAKSWYSQDRPSIGMGKQAPVPKWLNYELWQRSEERRVGKECRSRGGQDNENKKRPIESDVNPQSSA